MDSVRRSRGRFRARKIGPWGFRGQHEDHNKINDHVVPKFVRYDTSMLIADLLDYCSLFALHRPFGYRTLHISP